MKTNNYFKSLTIAYSFSTFSEGIIMPIYAIFVQRIGGDILEASGAVGVFLLVSGITTYLIHRLNWSQKNKKFLMVLGWAIWVIGICFYLVISNTLTLFIAQILIALGNAVADPAFDAELTEQLDKDKTSLQWGIFESMKDIFSGFAAIIGGLIANYFGFDTLIIVMIVSATFSLGLILRYLQITHNFKQMKPKV